MKYGNGLSTFSCAIPSLLFDVLEVVGTAAGTGELIAQWANLPDGSLALTLESVSFTGSVKLKKSFDSYCISGFEAILLKPGMGASVGYKDLEAPFDFRNVKNLALPGVIYHSCDWEASECAARLAFFYKAAYKHTVECRAASGLKRFSLLAMPAEGEARQPVPGVACDGATFAIHAPDRNELGRLTTRLLNIINHYAIPEYRPAASLTGEEEKYFTFRRF